MRRVDLAIALHFHQPVGNFTEIFERAYERCYRPFLKHLSYYPDIQMTLHISGSLLEFFQKSHPEILKTIKDMLSRGQIEIMGGPFYEPILPAIPPRDIRGQMALMRRNLKDEFSIAPKGAWIPERVWRPSIIKDLHRQGARYCILDDTHLIKAGKKKSDTYGFFTTGGLFRRIAVFASDKRLRYTIPFKEPQETIDYFRSASSSTERPLFVYADDVEKFGEWPGTYGWVYKDGWIRRFFDAINRNREWINTVKFSDYTGSHRPLSKVKIPEASYEEMEEWAGGSWLNFLKKSPEADHIYRKMRYVSDKVRWLWMCFTKKQRQRRHWAKVELYRGQCNCGWWHGVFGGLYMYHLRSAVYNHLIAAANIADGAGPGKKAPLKIKELDYDGDGRNEFIAENNLLSLYFDPEDGGSLKELDYRPICANIINGISRKTEPYHKEVGKKEPSLAKKLLYDKYERSCLRDYFLPAGLSMKDFVSGKFDAYSRFENGPYAAARIPGGLVLELNSRVKGLELKLSKEVTVSDNIVKIQYIIKKLAGSEGDILFGTEFNLTMPYLNSERYRYFSNGRMLGTLNTAGSTADTASFEIRDSGIETDLEFKFSRKPQEIWYFPVETVSKSQVSYTANFQCSCVFPLWKPVFNKEGLWQAKIAWKVG